MVERTLMALPIHSALRSPRLTLPQAGNSGPAEEPRRPEREIVVLTAGRSPSPESVHPARAWSTGKSGATPLQRGAPGVHAELSPAARQLAAAGVDVTNSRTVITGEKATFQLSFTARSTERLTAEGNYRAEEGTLSLSYTYRFQQVVVENGQERARSFEVRLNLQVDHISETKAEPTHEQEDILALVRRLLEDISRLVADDEHDLGGVILNREDLLDLMSIDDGRIAKKLEALIQMTVALARLRAQLKGDRELVVLWPQRKEEEGIRVESFTRDLTQFELSIHEVNEVGAPPAGNGEIAAEAAEGVLPDHETGN
ncbi:hypothetical protein ACFLZR_01125 [Candidatus Neomarinimicrobiota bacterium]